ncbi:MAG: class I SAM-dependent methyltransferase [Sandaracinaceae bacterium]
MTTADAQFWDNLAEKYSAKPIDNVPAYERKLEITKARLRPRHVILDIGCGTGSLALELAPHVAHVHAMDVSGEMLRIARSKADAGGTTNVTFHRGTLDEPHPFDPGTFAGVCAYNILHLVDDRPGMLRTIFELLEPGGFFVSSTVCLSGSWTPFGLILPVMRWLGQAPRVWMLDHGTVEREIRGAGFIDVEEIDVGGGPRVAFVVATKPSGTAVAA